MSPIFRPPLFYRDRQFDPFYVKPATQSNGELAVLNSPRRITYYALIIALAFSLSLPLYGAPHMSSIPLDYGFPLPPAFLPSFPLGALDLYLQLVLAKAEQNNNLWQVQHCNHLSNNWGYVLERRK